MCLLKWNMMAIQAFFSKYDAHKVSFGFLATKYMEGVKKSSKMCQLLCLPIEDAFWWCFILFFYRFNIHVFMFISNPTLNNLVKIQQIFGLNIMWHRHLQKKFNWKLSPFFKNSHVLYMKHKLYIWFLGW
jgi:hypothetical protein